MPVRITCHQCKSVLYENPELVSPSEILEKHDSKCPKCSTPLIFDPSGLVISVNMEERRGLLRLFQR